MEEEPKGWRSGRSQGVHVSTLKDTLSPLYKTSCMSLAAVEDAHRWTPAPQRWLWWWRGSLWGWQVSELFQLTPLHAQRENQFKVLQRVREDDVHCSTNRVRAPSCSCLPPCQSHWWHTEETIGKHRRWFRVEIRAWEFNYFKNIYIFTHLIMKHKIFVFDSTAENNKKYYFKMLLYFTCLVLTPILVSKCVDLLFFFTSELWWWYQL